MESADNKYHEALLQRLLVARLTILAVLTCVAVLLLNPNSTPCPRNLVPNSFPPVTEEPEGVLSSEADAEPVQALKEKVSDAQTQTSDHWPVFSKPYFSGDIPASPFHPNFTIKWDFNTNHLLQRADVKGLPHKIILWMVKPRYMPELPEPVRLRVCPEMPCQMTSNKQYQKESAALLWNGQIMRDPTPPKRSHPDQVFVFHNTEPQVPDWIKRPSFRKPAWMSSFNWTMHYRLDSDIVDPYGYVAKRQEPLKRNYTDILAKKTKMAALMSSHCSTHGKREKYVKLLQKHLAVDVFGDCGPAKCPRRTDDVCLRTISREYKFFLSFENAFCRDYISEKFFRYLETDAVVVARGSNEYRVKIIMNETVSDELM